MENVSETECANILHKLSLGIEVCKGICEANSDCTHASPNLWRFVFEFTIKSAVNLVVEPPMTVDLRFCC